jgi:1,2-phenylacetyl-CoA epoxidase catalytic subunit
MSNGWTPERKARQAALIRTWKPWAKFTGPRTEEGKARAARNGDKGGEWKIERDKVRELKQTVGELLRRQRELLRRVFE